MPDVFERFWRDATRKLDECAAERAHLRAELAAVKLERDRLRAQLDDCRPGDKPAQSDRQTTDRTQRPERAGVGRGGFDGMAPTLRVVGKRLGRT